MIFQWKWVYHKCVKKTRQNDWRCFLGTRRKIAARILCAFQGSGRQFFTLDIVSYFPPWSNCFSAKVCLKKWMIMTPFACHWHFDCAAENLLCALLIFGSCAETKVFVIVKKNASLWRGCAHKKPAPCQMTWCRTPIPVCAAGLAMHKDGKTTDNNRTRQKFCCPFRQFKTSVCPL